MRISDWSSDVCSSDLPVAFSGTLVTAGQGTGVVVATGARTELGRITQLLGTVKTLTTPLLRRMNTFAKWLTGAILLVAAAVFAWAVAFRAFPPTDALLAVIGMAVAATPDGLPAVLTITLAHPVQRDRK